MIKTNNKMIAIFLGWVEQTNPSEKWLGSFKTEDGTIHKNTNTEPLLFHCDWNWINIVILGISNRTGYELVSGYDYSYWNNMGDNPLDEFGGYESIDGIYEACVEFIKWYNENNQN